MKPFGREKKYHGSGHKTDCHAHPKRLYMNWWEDVCECLSRTTQKKNVKKEIQESIENGRS